MKKPLPKEKKQSLPTEAKLGRMQTFLNTMTPTEREKFRDSALNNDVMDCHASYRLNADF